MFRDLVLLLIVVMYMTIELLYDKRYGDYSYFGIRIKLEVKKTLKVICGCLLRSFVYMYMVLIGYALLDSIFEGVNTLYIVFIIVVLSIHIRPKILYKRLRRKSEAENLAIYRKNKYRLDLNCMMIAFVKVCGDSYYAGLGTRENTRVIIWYYIASAIALAINVYRMLLLKDRAIEEGHFKYKVGDGNIYVSGEIAYNKEK